MFKIVIDGAWNSLICSHVEINTHQKNGILLLLKCNTLPATDDHIKSETNIGLFKSKQLKIVQYLCTEVLV